MKSGHRNDQIKLKWARMSAAVISLDAMRVKEIGWDLRKKIRIEEVGGEVSRLIQSRELVGFFGDLSGKSMSSGWMPLRRQSETYRER